MNYLSPRLQLRVSQKQTLTPGLVQMVTVLQLNRLELRAMIAKEISENPVLEEVTDEGEELTPPEVQASLEGEREPHPADESFLVAAGADQAGADPDGSAEAAGDGPADSGVAPGASPTGGTDPFNEIDFGSFFDDYLDPGYRAPASEPIEKPSFEMFLSSPVTLADYLRQQLSLVVLSEPVRSAADSIVGNLDENGYLTSSPEEIAAAEGYSVEDVNEALRVVQTLDPAGVGARTLQECLLLQLANRDGQGGVAWEIVAHHLDLLESHRTRELAKVLGRPLEHIKIAIRVIQHLDPRPGLRYSGPGARQIEPEVYIFKEGEDYLIQLNDDGLPRLKLNLGYRQMVNRRQEPSKEVRNYVKERYNSALQLMKNIEQRKQTILKVCEAIVKRQREFLDKGIDFLKPMMIKEVAEEIGVHPSTVSRAVANKYAHTPQGVYELRYFFSEAVQGPSGAATPLLLLKRKVKKMIEAEDPRKPLTDEQIAQELRKIGIQVTRRTVAKYREDMRIPSTHRRRVRD